ncbi:MAG: hypothetical protein QOJ42_2776, partial [Acidobacteriaceae bacterium]|nr:hypothetical protein [Acidobacteriaceae bacterium]
LIGEDKNRVLINKLTEIGFEIVEEDGFVITMRQSA